jgi:radical SAM superfamily enzyme YgiQ (UPF0313 family)
MKVLLLQPPTWESGYQNESPPLGLAYIASVLELNNHVVSVLDPNVLLWNENQILKQISNFGPDVVGVNCQTWNRFEAYSIVKKIKKELPFTITVMGGLHVSALSKETFEYVPELDFIVIGEGEFTMLKLIDSLEKGDNPNKIDGLAFPKDNQVVVTPPRAPIDDLDKLPIPAYHLLSLDRYRPNEYKRDLNSLKFSAMITSRGCPTGCKYCYSSGFWGRKFRARSPKKVVDEVDFLVNHHNVGRIHFSDDAFTANPQRAKRICEELIRRDLNIKFRIMARADTIDRELLGLLKNAGCYQIDYGVESGSPRIMKNINKKLNLERALETFSQTKQKGIDVSIFIMLGLPGERHEDIMKTKDFIKKADIDKIVISITTIVPGSPLYFEALSKGLITPEIWSTYNSGTTHLNFDITKDIPPYLEYFTLEELQNYARFLRVEGWKKRGKKFYIKKVMQQVREPKKVINYLLTKKN